jgi:two-component system, NtrC family, response regulator GlrR
MQETLREVRLPSVRAARARPFLSWSDASGPHRVRLDRDTVLGSSEAAVVRVVGDPTVSRLHAAIELRRDGVWVRDLDSTNGTVLDGVTIRHARLSAEGGLLKLGNCPLRISAAVDQVPLWPTTDLGGMAGISEAMREFFMQLNQLGTSGAPVLLHGETGTGKDVAAQALHTVSGRHHAPFVVVDCAAVAESLLESELFGHAKGSFTGAERDREGVFEQAHGGTVFLDEIGELPLAMQPRLLRVLEAKTVRRVGENSVRPVDVRVIAATHRDLEAMVTSGEFREDLYFRLAVLQLRVPPLRERLDDVPLLLSRFTAEPLPDGALEKLQRYHWPGNVRELRNFAQRLATLGFDESYRLLTKRTLPTPGPVVQRASGGPPPVNTDQAFKELRDVWLDYLERAYLVELIARHGRRSPLALAEAAGLDRSYMHRLLKKHGL